MKLKLREDPREWRKAAWFSALGLSLLSALLRWRHVLSLRGFVCVLSMLALIAIAAWRFPRWFRRWYRFGGTLGFYVGRAFGFVMLSLIFFLVITPLGLVMRLFGKDSLHLKRPDACVSYWSPARKATPMDKLF